MGEFTKKYKIKGDVSRIVDSLLKVKQHRIRKKAKATHELYVCKMCMIIYILKIECKLKSQLM